MAITSANREDKQRSAAQRWGVAFFLICTQSLAHNYTCTYIDGECVVEFGDHGKAPNQYVTEVGEQNVISSKIVTQIGDTILINDSFAPSSNESSSNAGGSSAALRPSSQPTE